MRFAVFVLSLAQGNLAQGNLAQGNLAQGNLAQGNLAQGSGRPMAGLYASFEMRPFMDRPGRAGRLTTNGH